MATKRAPDRGGNNKKETMTMKEEEEDLDLKGQGYRTPVVMERYRGQGGQDRPHYYKHCYLRRIFWGEGVSYQVKPPSNHN